MTRHECRAVALKITFAYLDNSQSFDFDKNLSIACEIEPTEEELVFIKSLVNCVIENYANIKSDLEKQLRGYGWDRIYKVDKALLLLCYAEVFTLKDAPQNVVINEILELAKEFSAEKSVKFINGVIATVIGVSND